MNVSIRGRILLLILGITIPFTLLGLFALQRVWSIGRSQLNDSIEQQAELAALAFERWVDAQREPLDTIAAIAADDKFQSSEPFDYVVKTRSHWIDLHILDAAGNLIRSYPPEREKPPPALLEHLLNQSQNRKSWLLVTDRTMDESRPIVGIATPIRTGGAVVARVDGTAINDLFSQIQLPGNAVIVVFDSQGQILFRKQNDDTPLMTEVSSSPLFGALGAKKAAVAELQSPYDAIERVYGLSKAGPTDFVIAIGVPSATLYEPVSRQFTRYAILSLLAVVFALLAAILMQRKIIIPIQRLSVAAGALGKGDYTVSAPTNAGGEIGELGAAFNRMAQEIKEREERLTELDRLKSDFVSSVSHELRTPLTTISTLVHVLKKSEPTDTERQKYLETIAAECDRQIDLVTNLLDLSRIESGAYKIELKRVDAAEVILACQNIARHAAELRRIRLVTELPDERIEVLANSGALQRVISTLVENAIKYTRDFGRITLGLSTVNGDACIYIKDDGYGIDPEDLPHIFERFYQGRISHPGLPDTRGEQPGVGLGLFVVQGIVNQLGGKITVESKLGQGSIFRVFLPKWVEEKGAMEESVSVEAVTGS